MVKKLQKANTILVNRKFVSSSDNEGDIQFANQEATNY